jgi:hypothetical protein
MPRTISLSKILKQMEILYIQGASIGSEIGDLNRETHGTAARQKKSVDWLFDVKIEGKIHTAEMPLVLIIYSPFYKPVVYQGEEAYPFIPILEMLDLPIPTDPAKVKLAKRDCIAMINGLEPYFQILRDQYWKNGITNTVKRKLHLQKENIIFRFI